jgi:hypothetical protein
MADNAQVSASRIRVDLLPEILVYQNAGVPASLYVAPPYTVPTRSGNYRTLRGDGLLDLKPGLTDLKPELGEAIKSSMSYGRQDVELGTFRWGLVEVDDIQYQDLTAQGVDYDSDWLRVHAPQGLTLHSYILGQKLADTPTFTGKTGTTLVLTGDTGNVELALQEALAFFEETGAYAAAAGGGSLYCYMNSRTARRLRIQNQIADTSAIAGVASGGSVARLGYNPLSAFQRYLDAVADSPVPIVELVDRQFLAGRTPTIPDGIFFMMSTPRGKGSFISTPVFDYSQIAGMAPGEISAHAGGTPLSLVSEYEITQGARGHGFFMEATFGLDLYGSTDASTQNNLGFKIPVTLPS